MRQKFEKMNHKTKKRANMRGNPPRPPSRPSAYRFIPPLKLSPLLGPWGADINFKLRKRRFPSSAEASGLWRVERWQL